jgi:DNA polymerase-3 subunit alpha
MISNIDKERILKLLNLNNKSEIPNPHNSIILYVTGLSNQFDYEKGRSNSIGGSPPDIDIDHDALDRDKAIQWVVDYWGRDNVAQVITHGTFKPKSLARSYYRVTDGDTVEMSNILKAIPPPKYGKEATLGEIIEKNPDLPEKYKNFHGFATKLEDMVANFGIHAAGVVISDFPISDIVPVWKNSKADRITQFDKNETEEFGLLKFDFLSIDTLSIIKETIELIKENKGIEIDPYAIEDGDKKAYALLHQGLMAGIFQMETSGMAKNLIQKIKPMCIPDLSDTTALNRPGPIQAGLDKKYIDNKNKGYSSEEMPEVLAVILKDTHWTLVYQEQVMAICSKLAGFSLKESDDVRRAMGKKNTDILDRYKKRFIEGAMAKKTKKNFAEELWDDLVGFADYCFNKAHSVSYSILTYITAYLKANYPVEFFCALMSVRSKVLQPKLWARKAPGYIQEARVLGVEINAPSVNGSLLGFSSKDQQIYFGFSAIRDVGKTAARSIVTTRGKTPYKNIWDFLGRINQRKVTIRTFTSLVMAGAFDKLGYNRGELLEKAESLYNYTRDLVECEQRKIDSAARSIENEQVTKIKDKRDQLKKDLKQEKKNLKKAQQAEEAKIIRAIETIETELAPLEEMKIRRLPELKLKPEPVKVELLRGEEISLSLDEIMNQAHYIGCYADIHPALLVNNGCDKLSSLWTGQQTKVCGVVNSLKVIKTKRGAEMAFMEIDDSTQIAEAVIFPRTWAKMRKTNLAEGKLVHLNVKVEEEEPTIKLIAESIQIYEE